MENPAAWDRATRVISNALTEADLKHEAGYIGFSRAMQIRNALWAEGLLVEEPTEPEE